jgi:plasmid stability protein
MSSQTETIEITGLPTGTKAALEQIARSDGKSGEEFARTLIQAEILSRRPLSEILAPIRKSFEESGMTEQELDVLIEEVREQIWKERTEKGK